ncbi:hypothetical protein NQ317_004879 [Molorchus minor]|uniref:Uncharacterized protein n=1 Tax=Molorchus minor TaxID=1323400 RepID=A0ABQ9IXK6_9CUCU|nr:hypothetical protein NQ317_004879 [Molorchus minor]
MRFGDKHLQQVYQAQQKSRNQRINENLQQYEADIARLVYLAYPTAPRDFIEQLAVQVFIDGIPGRLRDPTSLTISQMQETERSSSLRLGNPSCQASDDVENLRQNIKDIQTSLQNIVEQADRRNQTTSFRRKVPIGVLELR